MRRFRAGLFALMAITVQGNAMADTITSADQALRLAEAEVAKSRHDMVILPDRTLEYEYGWVFTYVPRRFLETKDPQYAVPGNGPLVVQRDGKIALLPSARPVRVEADAYLAEWKSHR